MNELEDIGRYHQLADAVHAKVSSRNDLLFRASRVLSGATDTTLNIGAVGRKCNFDAVERLLAQAKGEHDGILAMIDEMNALAPVVNKPPTKLD